MASSILCALGGFRRVTSRSDLLSIRRATAPSDFGREEARFIERLIRPRGRKSGQRHKGVNSIPTVISKSRKFSPPNSLNLDNLIPISCISKYHEPRNIQFSIWNARSLCNKVSSVCAMILDESRDIFVVSESWLTEVNQKCITSEIRSSLGGYNFFSCPRTGQKGSGVAAFALGALDVNMIVTKPYKSLEGLDLTVKTGSIVLRLVVMYRPPKLCTVSVFFEEFSELLETLIPAEGRLFICGDMNFHVDDVENRDAQRLLDLIHSMGLVQYMQVATHQKGHTLDLIITLSGQGTIQENM
ncbi:hypothetical protein Pmani_006915 [Petrolisthes manimaculis]|uniref:Endonuclease/exonuclease/phosphatase domain-containing protein n=1 Tax=Petrolisthes manimaculis TaxID=1843537 RepID=A0AAE1QA04_9EUCA|nr:hypothetical protein Pmani_006915 [Petrolisthes manimaculis]